MGMGVKRALFISCEFIMFLKDIWHIYESCYSMNKNNYMLKIGFQSAYTTLFGAYAAFLFAKTGEIILPSFFFIVR